MLGWRMPCRRLGAAALRVDRGCSLGVDREGGRFDGSRDSASSSRSTSAEDVSRPCTNASRTSFDHSASITRSCSSTTGAWMALWDDRPER